MASSFREKISIQAAKIGKVPLLLIILFFFILSLLLTANLFKGEFVIAGGDNNAYLGYGRINPYYAWDNWLNFGNRTIWIANTIPLVIFWKLLSFLPGYLTQKLFLLLVFFISLLTYFFFLKTVFREKSFFILVPSVLLYLFNLYNLDPVSPYPRLVFAALPLLFTFLYRLLNERNFKYGVLFALASVFYSAANSNISYVAPLILVCLFYSSYFLLSNLKRKRLLLVAIRNLFFLLILYLFINLWWLIPYLSSFGGIVNLVVKVNPFTSLGSGYFFDYFRYLGNWSWYSSHFLSKYFSFSPFFYQLPLLIVTFSVPVAAFLSICLERGRLEGEQRRIFYFFVFLSLISLFLSKGIKSPFGAIYAMFYDKLPFSWVFREPFPKFMMIYVFSLPVLLYFFLKFLSEKIKNKLGQAFLVAFPLSIIFISSYPLLTGEIVWSSWNGTMRDSRVAIPKYWEDFSSYSKSLVNSASILVFPKIPYGSPINWAKGYSSGGNHLVYFTDLNVVGYSSGPITLSEKVVNELYQPDNLKSGTFNRFLSLLNISFVLLENDLDWRFVDGTMNPKANQAFLSSGLRMEKSFGVFDDSTLGAISNYDPDIARREALYSELKGMSPLVLYRVGGEEAVTSKFYVPKGYFIVNSEEGSVGDVVSLDTWNICDAVFFRNQNPGIESVLVGGRRGTVTIPYPKIRSYYLSTPDIPYIPSGVAVSPSDRLYFLVRLKEDWLIFKEASPFSKMDQLLWLASKRAAEYRLMPAGEKRAELAQDYVRKLSKTLSLLDEYKGTMDAEAYASLVKKIFLYKGEAAKSFGSEEAVIAINNEVDYLYFSVFSPLDYREYSVDVPENGRFLVLIRKDNLAGEFKQDPYIIGNLEIDDSERFSMDRTKVGENWYQYGEVFLKAGKHRVRISIPERINLFNGFLSQPPSDLKVANSGEGIRVQQPRNDLGLFSRWEPVASAKYLISFDYRYLSDKNPVEFSFWQKEHYSSSSSAEPTYKEKAGERVALGMGSASTYYESYTDKQEWKRFTKVVTSNQRDAEVGFSLNFKNDYLDIAENLDIDKMAGPESRPYYFGDFLVRDIRVERVWDPRLLFFHTDQEWVTTQPPEITYTQIDPTRYWVKVRGATGPFNLIFSETYDKGWKVRLGVARPSPFSTYTSFPKKVVSMLSTSFLEEKDHLIANGFANSWRIDPLALKAGNDFELEVEYRPQRLAYLGVVISAITAFILICSVLAAPFIKYLIKTVLRK